MGVIGLLLGVVTFQVTFQLKPSSASLLAFVSAATCFVSQAGQFGAVLLSQPTIDKELEHKASNHYARADCR